MGSEKLELRVAAVNAAHAYANELYTKLAPIFEQFVNQKVKKADGDLLEKIKKLLPVFPSDSHVHVQRNSSVYSLSWSVRVTTWNNGNVHKSHEATAYIADLSNGILTRIYNAPELRTNYSVEQVQAAREAYEVAKKAADQAQSDLFPFGEWDH